MSQVVFVNRYFYPDLSATSQILTDLAFHLAQTGTQVTVITGRRRYTDASETLVPYETIRGVNVVRVATTGFGRSRLVGRAIDYLSFYVSALWQLARTIKRRDIVVAKTDPPLMSVVAALAVRLKGARQVNWLQDLFPEVAMVLEPDFVSGFLARIARAARDWSLRQAQLNVVLGELMYQRVLSLGVPGDRVQTIPNWTDDRAIVPIDHGDNPLRTEWNVADKFVVAYSGNLGRAHEFRTFMKAATRLNHRRDIVFLVIGGGAQMRNVRNFAAGFGLKNVLERPYQPRERLRYSLGVADLHVVSLKPALEGLIVPSKFYGIAAAQRATAFIGDPNGEVATLLKRFDCGRSFAVGDEESIAGFIEYSADNREECERMGLNARRALDQQWCQDKAFAQWRNALHTMTTSVTECKVGAR
jgi:glycosyltransferase involved in cell wall biosynthesis